jgi:hypothetical protein
MNYYCTQLNITENVLHYAYIPAFLLEFRKFGICVLECRYLFTYQVPFSLNTLHLTHILCHLVSLT